MADQIYSLTISQNIAGQFAQNIVHFRFDDAGYNSTLEAAEALNLAFDGSRKALLAACLPTSTTILSFKARRVSGGGGFEAIMPQSAGNVGTRAGAVSVAGLSPCVVGYPALPTNRPRARFFLCGVSDSDIVDGVFTAAFKAAVAGSFGTLFDPLTLAGGGGPVATFVLNFTPVASATVISDWLLSDACGQIRRRQIPA